MSDRGERIAVVLFNLGGPDSPAAVRPFLFNLFNDAAIIALRQPLRTLVAWLIARRRTRVAQAIYAHIGGRSPILTYTETQARALAECLGDGYRCFIAMRYWHPRAAATMASVKEWAPDKIILLPLYPQFSMTSTASSLHEWAQIAAGIGVKTPTHPVCCWPDMPGFVEAVAQAIREKVLECDRENTRILFSAHGLPEIVIQRGDPYQWQVEQSVAATMAQLRDLRLEHVICYQSRVGPLRWLGPSTIEEIERAGHDGKNVIVMPIAFVSEHSETLVELDIEYEKVARAAGVTVYLRAPTVDARQIFIAGLADIVRKAANRRKGSVFCGSGDGGRICPSRFSRCPNGSGAMT